MRESIMSNDQTKTAAVNGEFDVFGCEQWQTSMRQLFAWTKT